MFIKKEMELSLIGLQAAGKSSLVNVLTTGVFHEEMIPTVGPNAEQGWRGGSRGTSQVSEVENVTS